MRYHVAPAPVRAAGDFEAPSLRTCARLAARAATMARTQVSACAIVAQTPDDDVTVCLTLAPPPEGSASADGVVARWDQSWLLITSAAHDRRAAARDHLRLLLSRALDDAEIRGRRIDEGTYDDDF